MGLLTLPSALVAVCAPTPDFQSLQSQLPYWLWLGAALLLGQAIWMAYALFGAALVESPAWSVALSRVGACVGQTLRVTWLQMGRAAWVLGKYLLAGSLVLGLALWLGMQTLHGVHGSTAQIVAIMFATLWTVGFLAVPLFRLQMEYWVMVQNVVQGNSARLAHREAVSLCRGNILWLLRGYLLHAGIPIIVGAACTATFILTTGVTQLPYDHPLFAAQTFVWFLLTPVTITFPAIAADNLRRVHLQHVEVRA